MDFANDKDLFKFGLIVVLICLIPLCLFIYVNAGVKAALFAIWIVFGVFAFCWIITAGFQVNIRTDSQSFLRSFMNIWGGYYGYRLILSVFFILFIALSCWVWGVLDDWVPAKGAEASSRYS